MNTKNQQFAENLSTLGFVFSGIFTLISVLAVFYYLPNIFGDRLVLDNYKGVDHYYDGYTTFAYSCFLLLVSAGIFIAFLRKMIK